MPGQGVAIRRSPLRIRGASPPEAVPRGPRRATLEETEMKEETGMKEEMEKTEKAEKTDWIPWMLDRIAMLVVVFFVLAIGASTQYYFHFAATIFFICSGICVTTVLLSYFTVIIAMAGDIEED
jgi:hypothetical protein